MYFKCAQDYSLSALHHAIPPPWGSHLSLPPNKSKTENPQEYKSSHRTHRRIQYKKIGKESEIPSSTLPLTGPVRP
jgi:hypothetical protein